MAGPTAKSMVIASLFDRLTDYQPRNSREVLPPERDQRQEFKASIARGLTSLFNIRRNESDIPEEFEQTRESLAAYGLPDFATAPMDREAIRRGVERPGRRFEPRWSRVQVTEVEGGEFTFSFRISGMLRVDLGVEPVVYDAE